MNPKSIIRTTTSSISKNTTLRTVILGLLLIGLSACSSSKEAVSEDQRPIDIDWLTQNLHDDGIFVNTRGEADANITANLSRRLVLNRNEFVDVYYFDDMSRAESQAHIYAGRHPNARVYRYDGLVVIRYTEHLTEVSSSLHVLMGATI